MALVLPSEAEIKLQIGAAAKLVNEHRKWLAENSPNYVGLETSLVQLLEGPEATRAASAIAAMRGNEDGALKAGREILLPLLETYALVLGRPVTRGDAAQVFDALYDLHVSGSKYVTSRGFTFGTPSAAGGNVGTGVINRLTKDENDFPLESQFADAKSAIVVSDYRNGREQGREQLEFRGSPKLPDGSWVQLDGSGRIATLQGLTGTDSEQFIGNPSFSLYSGTTGSPTLTSWTQSGTVTLDGTNYYRALRGETAPYALQFTTTGYVQQSLDARKVNFDPRVPVYAQVAWNAEVGTGVGTLVLTLGGKTATVAVSGQTGWQILRIALDKSCWYKQWNQNSALVKVAWTKTSGNILIDDVIVAPMTNFDGSWYAVVGGATPFLRNDSWTWTDTATESILQRMFWLYFARYLPASTGGTVTWSDP